MSFISLETMVSSSYVVVVYNYFNGVLGHLIDSFSFRNCTLLLFVLFGHVQLGLKL